MASAKLIVMYPRPENIDEFESIYHNQHVPMAAAKLAGKTKIVASKVLDSPQKPSRFHRIAEIHFPSMQILEACAASDWWPAGTGKRHVNFHGWAASCVDSKRRDLRFCSAVNFRTPTCAPRTRCDH